MNIFQFYVSDQMLAFLYEMYMLPVISSSIVAIKAVPRTTVLEYAQFLGSRLRNYVIGTLAMFDNIKHELLSSPDFDADQAIWP